jgi:membrane protease YdiL (CAAX protease family)
MPAEEREAGSNLALARALTAIGDLEAARQSYRHALTRDPYVTLDTRVEYFAFEPAHGTWQDAVAAYDALRKEGFAADSLARHRLSFFLARPGLSWQWRDVPGVLTVLGTALAFGLVPLLVILPVHYRGLALRSMGRAPNPGASPWSLREAWYAAAVFVLAGFMALYAFALPHLEVMLPWTNRVALSPATDRVLARVLLWSIVVSLILLAPLLRGRSIRSLLCGSWPIKRSVFVGIGFALLLKVVAGIFVRAFRDVGMLGSDTARSMQGAYDSYGLGVLLLLVAVAVPLVEELVFRGAMLGAFRGHVSFLFATIVQAAAFTLAHEEWQSMPFLFVFALTAAWLAKRSEGLLAPMVMHGVNNLIAGLAIVGATQVLNR